MLCARCQNFDIQVFQRDSYPYRGIPLLATIRSAKVCSFCSLLLQHLIETQPDINLSGAIFACKELRSVDWLSSEPLKWLLYWADTQVTLPRWVNFGVSRTSEQPIDEDDGLNIASLNFFIGSLDDASERACELTFHAGADPGTQASISHDITGKLILEKPWSAHSLDIIRSWHNDCVLNHSTCNSTLSGTEICLVDNAPLPNRCIETLKITSRSGEPQWSHRLRDTSSHSGQYIILSHRWDEATDRSKTTQENIQCRIGDCSSDRHDICAVGIEGMPRLFVEACSLAYNLGIKYVWIDSICIIQPVQNSASDNPSSDELEDWNREAPKMASYYQNAWITVAASSSAVENGLFNMRRTGPTPRITRLPYRDKDGNANGYFYVQCARPDILHKEFGTDIEESDLWQRGWVYQERMLSRRTIIFSASGFFLHCHSVGPTSPTGEGLSLRKQSRAMRFKLDYRLMQKTGKSVPPYWNTIASEYSHLGLSKLAQDRLVALAGVASEVGLAMEVESMKGNPKDGGTERRQTLWYASGIWLFDPLRTLYWEQATPGLRRRVPGLPTWSWASMADRIKTLDNGQEMLVGGMKIRWPKSRVAHPESVSKIYNTTTITVDQQSWLPQFNRPVEGPPEYEYGNENRFVVLALQGRLLPVHIRAPFSEPDAKLAAELSRVYESAGARPWGVDLWRAVCIPSEPSTILGWASLEHPDLQSDDTVSACGQVFAFFLRRNEEKGGWLRPGALIATHISFSVMLLKRATMDTGAFDGCFERVGIGGLWGLEVEKHYQSAPEITLSLI